MSHLFDTQAYKDAGFTFEEIERIQYSLDEANAGKLIPDKEVWMNIRKNKSTYV